ncbi:hypothetical protein FGE12_18490 [Aggregicoccus sp. 17bor-14]|uniref:hypothetical protein n=1 Tax=Myxococcaceae TaxID=31 RepID=UPI00129C26D7|nr:MULTISPECIES: hypothetical protein [Myxococcaceae]MBF5044394.1 hypothetical protein [Simulacricoccus sp. 17bor-14]MRI90141.1 hypothetical protein [Aggregicoccus sp. 17bor-14]
MPSRSLRRALPLLELAALVAAALLALLFQLTLPSRLPSEDDHRAAAAALSRAARPGDVVLLWPWWTERARLFAPPGLPVVGYLGSDADDLDAHPRIWVLGQPELPRSDARAFEQAFLPGRTALAPAEHFGPLTLTPYANGRYRARRFDATAALASARVYLEGPDGARLPCPFDGAAHRCAGAPHLRVAAEWHEVAYQPRHCLWMHPPGGAARLVAEFDPVPAAPAYRLGAGIIWEQARKVDPERISDTEVTLSSGAAPLLSLTLPPGREGQQVREVALPPGPPRPLAVAVRAERAMARWVCVELQGLAPAAGGSAR